MVMKTKLIISLLAFLAITTLVSGQINGENSRTQNGNGQGPAYVDANQNGRCDNYENRTPNASFSRRSGNLNTCSQGQKQVRGRGQIGCGQGHGHGKNFVDSDKNGVCDHSEDPAKK
jgi:hypothetical protein